MSSESPVFAVISQGCAANFGDGERIARALSAGHPNCHVIFHLPGVQDATKRAPALQDMPEAIYLNVCTVKGNVGALKLLRTAFEMFPDVPLFITGCAPKDFREEALKVTDKVVFTNLEEIHGQAGNDNGAVKGNTLRESPFVGIVNI
ncbi:MAG: hypothetical protein IKH67_02255, partial [Lachnospiraceae bacterium]|nr:hypothetical protein [Lachnospiraceae bacterium]